MDNKLGLYEYKMLSEQDQWDYLWAEGIFISKRFEGNYKIILYQLGDFFVEVFYNSSDNAISHKRTFASKKLLNPYLWQLAFSWN